MESYLKYVIRSTCSILDALKALNNLSDDALTLLVINESEKMVGTVTDGDIRRKLIGGETVSASVTRVMRSDFSFVSVNEPGTIEKISQFRRNGIVLLPFLDSEGKIWKVYNLKLFKSVLPVDAVLMAGGKGERLRPLTENTPKPLLKVGDKAIIDYNIDNIISYGIEHINVTVNYLKEQLTEHFSQERKGVKIQCVCEPDYLGTIGSVKFVDTFYNDYILLMNSDLFTNINLEDFYLHCRQNQADMSIASIPYSIPVPYGIFELEERRVVEVKEKPTYHYYANAGIYLIKKQLLGLIPDGKFYNATDFIGELVKNGYKVVSFPLVGYWIDIGKHEDYKKAEEFVKHLR